MFIPVRQSPIVAAVVSQIERAILRGKLSWGARLQTERELAKEFGVSRTAIRDALNTLEGRGLIRVKVGNGGGTFVADANVDPVTDSMSTMLWLRRMTLSEIAEARRVIEGAVAELAAERADENDLKRLRECLDHGRRVVKQKASHLNASMDFHVALAEAAHNEVIHATVRAYHELLGAALLGMRDARSARATQTIHDRMLTALRSRDGATLRELTDSHLAESERRLRRWLQSRAGGRTTRHSRGAASGAVGAKRRVPDVSRRSA